MEEQSTKTTREWRLKFLFLYLTQMGSQPRCTGQTAVQCQDYSLSKKKSRQAGSPRHIDHWRTPHIPDPNPDVRIGAGDIDKDQVTAVSRATGSGGGVRPAPVQDDLAHTECVRSTPRRRGKRKARSSAATVPNHASQAYSLSTTPADCPDDPSPPDTKPAPQYLPFLDFPYAHALCPGPPRSCSPGLTMPLTQLLPPL